MQTITIPKTLTKNGDLVVVPKKYFNTLDNIKNRLLGEEADTDEAVRIFNKEKREGKLKQTKNFASILGLRKFK